MTSAAGRDLDKDTSCRTSASDADWSDSRLPIPMERASINMRMKPVTTMAVDDSSALAIPASKPTEEARLSSTPKVKLRMYSGWANLDLVRIHQV